jgi:hypothetical protein
MMVIIIIVIIVYYYYYYYYYYKKLHGLSPRANYTDRATAASRRSVANLCGLKVPRSQRDGSLRPYFSVF